MYGQIENISEKVNSPELSKLETHDAQISVEDLKTHFLNDTHDANNKTSSSDKGQSRILDNLAPLFIAFQAPTVKEEPLQINDSAVYHMRPEEHITSEGKKYYLYSVANPKGLDGIPGKSYNVEKMKSDKPVEFRVYTGRHEEIVRINPKDKESAREVLTYAGQLRDGNGNYFKYAAKDYFDSDPKSTNQGSLHERSIIFGKSDSYGKGPDLRFIGIDPKDSKNIRAINVYRQNSSGEVFNVIVEKFPEPPAVGVASSKWRVNALQAKVGKDGSLIELQDKTGKTMKYHTFTLRTVRPPAE